MKVTAFSSSALKTAEKELYFDDFVKLPCVLVRTIGYDFIDKPRPLWLRALMLLYLVLCLIFCAWFTYFAWDFMMAEIAAGANDLALVLRLSVDVIYNVAAIVKSLFFFRNLKSLKSLLQRFRDIFPISREDRLAYRVNDYYWPKWITTILYMQLFALSIILFLPFVEAVYEYFGALLTVGYANAKFGYYRMYPETTYGINHYNPLGYIIVYTMDIMNGHYCTVWMMGPDVWLVAFSIQLCMHFDYVSRTLENYKPSKKRAAQDLRVLAELVRKHQTVLKLADDVQENFSVLILVMLFSTASILFGAAELVITQGITAHVLGYLAFVPTGVGQFYMICYYGQLIINKSLQVSEAAYNQTWYNGCQSYKKSILTIMRRAQCHSEINAGGFQTTNLMAFESVMRMTYQLFAIWSTMTSSK
ncbi:odorant receptor 49a-like [Musca domestica]|uniref:Odorant receptor n=1 Tax=Musca domestica TaxID=7370 RepID=A0A9J7DF36_MUSDO|nr:odorant receptor 49a-like [Musca domestica]